MSTGTSPRPPPRVLELVWFSEASVVLLAMMPFLPFTDFRLAGAGYRSVSGVGNELKVWF